MGSDKAVLDVGGMSMIRRVAAALEVAGCRVMAIGRADSVDGIDALPDTPAGRRGPAAGLATALRIAAGSPVVLVGVDQPFLHPRTVDELLAVSEGDAVVPVAGGVRQPTCAVYWPHCGPIVDDLLAGAGDPSLHAVLDRVPVGEVAEATWRTWGENGDSWWSVNTPEALAAARARLE